MMQVQILYFGVLRDLAGKSGESLEIQSGTTISALLEIFGTRFPTIAPLLKNIAVSVNMEYAQRNQVLSAGDEVALLPPVSGGTDAIYTTLTSEPIAADPLIAAAKSATDGAVVVFDGIVRNHTRGRQTLFLDYEAYEQMAEKQLRELAAKAVAQYGVRQVTIVHRLGHLLVGETSVLIIVASAHRAAAYEASRWLIDTLKITVPIWKRETFSDGVVWADGEPFPSELIGEAGEGNR